MSAALEIFDGSLTGFYDVPDEKKEREEYLHPTMSKILIETLENNFNKRS